MTDMENWLNEPIPRRLALAVVIVQGASSFIATALMVRSLAKQSNAVIEDQQQTIHIYKEMNDLLLARADNETLVQLNKNLDYWRVVREIPIPSKDDE